MWNWILSDEAYRDEYHAVILDVAEVVLSGEYEEEAERVNELIFPYIEKDPKAFFPPDRVKRAQETLLRIAELRAESVRKQVDGGLAARFAEQSDGDKIDSSGVVIRDLGSVDDL